MNLSASPGPRLAVALFAVLLCAGAARAATASQYKQLAGPPAEMGAMATPDPAASATYSQSAVLPFRLEQDASGLWRWSTEVPVEGESLRFAVVMKTPQLARVVVRDPVPSRSSSPAFGAGPRVTPLGRTRDGIPADLY